MHSCGIGETDSAATSCPACQGKHVKHTCSRGKRQAKQSAKQRDKKRTRAVEELPLTFAGTRDQTKFPESSTVSEEAREIAREDELKSDDVSLTTSVPEKSMVCQLESLEAHCDDEQQIRFASLVLCEDDSDEEPDLMNSIQKELSVGSSQFETSVAHYDVTGQDVLMPLPQVRSCGNYCTRASCSVAAEQTRSTDFILSGLHVCLLTSTRFPRYRPGGAFKGSLLGGRLCRPICCQAQPAAPSHRCV